MTVVEMHACAVRELAMRRRVYPRWVAGGKMKQDAADHEIAAMEAIMEHFAALLPPPAQGSFLSDAS